MRAWLWVGLSISPVATHHGKSARAQRERRANATQQAVRRRCAHHIWHCIRSSHLELYAMSDSVRCTSRSPPQVLRSMELWAAARNAAHVAAQHAKIVAPHARGGNATMRIRPGGIVDLWTHFSSFTVFMVSSDRMHCVAYPVVWKGGNNGIQSVMEGWHERMSHGRAGRYSEFDRPTSDTPPDTSCASVWTEADSAVEPSSSTACMDDMVDVAAGRNASHQYVSSICNSSRRVFTFVREPLGHFVAGWAEYTARNVRYRGRDGKHRNVTEEDADIFLRSLIFDGHVAATFSFAHPFLHMAPMAGVRQQRFGWPEFVGRLEHADEDWAAIFEGTPMAHTKLDPSLGWHELSSSDAQDARQSMRNLLKQRTDLRHGLCTLIGADYDWLECLGYSRSTSRCWSGEALDEAAQPMCTHNPSCAAKTERQSHLE